MPTEETYEERAAELLKSHYSTDRERGSAPLPCSLSHWIKGVRDKFRLPWGDIPAMEGWNAKEKEYWEGYEACLKDLEKHLKANAKVRRAPGNTNESH